VLRIREDLRKWRFPLSFPVTFGRKRIRWLVFASQPTSKSVSQSRVFHSVSYRCFRRESRRSAVRDTTSTASLSRVRASTLVFRTFGLFRTAASQRRDLPPPEELFFLLHFVSIPGALASAPAPVICGMREGWLSHQNWTPLASSFACMIWSRGSFAPPFVGFRGEVIGVPRFYIRQLYSSTFVKLSPDAA